MRVSTLVAAVCGLGIATHGIAQPTASAPAVPTETAIPTYEPTSVTLAKAEQLLALVGARAQFDATSAQAAQVSRQFMLNEYNANDAGRAERERIDSNYPGGFEAFLERFILVLGEKFDAAYPQFLEQNKVVHARYVSEADLDSLIVALTRLNSAELSDEERTRERAALQSSPAATRLLAAVPTIRREMSSFGAAIGGRLGVEAYNQIAQEHPSIFGRQQ
jgi:hypothetical protein